MTLSGFHRNENVGIQTSCSDVSRRVLTNFLSGAGSGDEDLPRVSEDTFRVISGAGDSDSVGCSGH
jgi:hypothetical protein